MSIIIRKIETQRLTHRIRPELVVVSHAGKHDTSRYVLVTVHLRDGAKGWGEAATVPLWSGESAETAEHMIRHVFAPRLIGARFDHPREALAVMDRAAHANSFTKGAVEMAIWDAWARSRGVPASKLFADRKPVEWIPTRASVGAYPVPKTLKIAKHFWDSGIRTIKFKTGLPGVDDAARLRAVRDLLGDGPVFTVDYNGAFHEADDAVRAIEKLRPYRVALVEQPTHRDRIQALADVRRRVRLPIMADECIFTPDHLAEALDSDAFDVLSIYAGKNGGFTHSLDMVKTAQKAGKVCAIGSNLESDIGQAAMACLAAGLKAFPTEKIANDFPSSLYYTASSVTEPIPLVGGRIRVPTGPGFGVVPCRPGLRASGR